MTLIHCFTQSVARWLPVFRPHLCAINCHSADIRFMLEIYECVQGCWTHYRTHYLSFSYCVIHNWWYYLKRILFYWNLQLYLSGCMMYVLIPVTSCWQVSDLISFWCQRLVFRLENSVWQLWPLRMLCYSYQQVDYANVLFHVSNRFRLCYIRAVKLFYIPKQKLHSWHIK